MGGCGMTRTAIIRFDTRRSRNRRTCWERSRRGPALSSPAVGSGEQVGVAGEECGTTLPRAVGDARGFRGGVANGHPRSAGRRRSAGVANALPPSAQDRPPGVRGRRRAGA